MPPNLRNDALEPPDRGPSAPEEVAEALGRGTQQLRKVPANTRTE